MAWVCPNCSSNNESTSTQCFVCGSAKPKPRPAARADTPRTAGRPTERPAAHSDVRERSVLTERHDAPPQSIIVFSHLKMTVESVKEDVRNTVRFFKRLFGGAS